jgi:hypothetical protein
MAEVAGLVVGGVALASLFESCMLTFDLIDAGKNCSRDYQEAALIITLLGSRLRRWEEAYRTVSPSNTARDGELAEQALESVNSNLESLCKTAERYQQKDKSTNIASLTDRLQKMHVSSARSTGSTTGSKTKPSLRSKIIWALHDKPKVETIIQTVRFKIEELESLSQSLLPALQQRANADAEKLNLLPAYARQDPVSDDKSKDNDIVVLKHAAAQVDPRFVEAIIKASTGHFYENIVATDLARQNSGDYIAKDYAGPTSGARHCYQNIRAEGNARQQLGNMYGKSIFDD